MSSFDESAPMMPVAFVKYFGSSTEFEGLKPQQLYGMIKQGKLIPAVPGTFMVTLEGVRTALQEAADRRLERAKRTPGSTKRSNGTSNELDTQLKGVRVGDLISYQAGVMVRPLQHVRWESNFMVHTQDPDGRDVVWSKEALNNLVANKTVVVENPVKLLELLRQCVEQSWPHVDTTMLKAWIEENTPQLSVPGENSITKSFPEDVQKLLEEKRQVKNEPTKPLEVAR